MPIAANPPQAAAAGEVGTDRRTDTVPFHTPRSANQRMQAGNELVSNDKPQGVICSVILLKPVFFNSELLCSHSNTVTLTKATNFDVYNSTP